MAVNKAIINEEKSKSLRFFPIKRPPLLLFLKSAIEPYVNCGISFLNNSIINNYVKVQHIYISSDKTTAMKFYRKHFNRVYGKPG